MKPLGTILPLALLAAGGFAFAVPEASAAPAFVKLKENVATASTNRIATGNFTSSVTSGNLIVVWVWYNSPTQSVSTVTDTKGNPYIRATGPTTGAGAISGWRQELWYAKNVIGGTSLNVTGTFTGIFSARKSITAHEYSGVDTVSPLDATAASAVAGSNVSTVSAATSVPNELIFGAAFMQNGGSAGSGFTRRSSIGHNVSEDKTITVPGNYAATFANTSQAAIVQMATFKAAGSVTDTQPPTTPASLLATAVSASQINLSWSASTDNVGVAGYRVFRGSVGIATTTLTAYSDPGLAPNTAYSYTVSAFDAAGNTSSPSSPATGTTFMPDTTPPTTPANLAATSISASQIQLTWAASSDDVGVAGYQVFRGGVLTATTTAPSFTDSNLKASTAYSYTTAAFDAAGNISPQSVPASATTLAGPYQPVYPLKTSSNGRYLVDQNNIPFLMAGDSPQSLISQNSALSAGNYLADRKAHGFNTVWINLLCDGYTFCNANGTTYDGIAPFTAGTSPTNYDLSTPNETYFARADQIISLAAQNGLIVVLDPIETGGWLQTLENNGATKALNYGAWVGNRYKNTPNIIWMSGNDFTTWNTNSTDNNLVKQVMAGIASADPTRLQTIELDYSLSSYSNQDTALAPYLTLDAAYSYAETHDVVRRAYSSTPVTPVFMVEANYEGESNNSVFTTPLILRHQEYWTMTSGATGQLYGNYYTDRIANGWQSSNIDTSGVTQLQYMTSLFSAYPWWNLVPDLTNSILTAGYGTFNPSNVNFTNSTYATAAWIPDGTLAIAYAPTSTSLAMDLTKMAGMVTARWYDPTNGTFRSIAGSPFANSTSQNFPVPGANSANENDWVLVLTASAVPDTIAPSAPTNLGATAVSASQVNLSWMASTDNVGVAGYHILRGSQIFTTSAISYSDSGLNPMTSYSYTVTAFDAAGNNSQSASATVTTPAIDTQAPTIPPNVQPSNITATSVTLSWTASTDNVAVAGYNVFRNSVLKGVTSVPSYTDSPLTASTTYMYSVSAFDASSNVSAQSPPLSVTTSVPPATAAFVQLQESRATASSGAIASGSFASSVTSGNLVVIWVWYNSNTQSISSVTDTKGNVYALAAGPTTGTGNLSGWRQELWYAKNVAGGTGLSVTASFTGSFAGEKSISAHEYSGVDKIAPLDATAAAAGAGTNVSSPTATTAFSNELIFGAGLFGAVGTSGPAFTQRSSIAGNVSEDRNVTTTGSYNVTFTNGNDTAITQMATFKAASQ